MMIFAYIHEHFFYLALLSHFSPVVDERAGPQLARRAGFRFPGKTGLASEGSSAAWTAVGNRQAWAPKGGIWIASHSPFITHRAAAQEGSSLALSSSPSLLSHPTWSCHPFLFLFLLCWNHLPWTPSPCAVSGSPCWVTFPLHSLMNELFLQNARASATSSLKSTWLARIQLGTSSSRHL